VVSGNAITIDGQTFTAGATTSGNTFAVGGSNSATGANLASVINANTTLTAAGYSAVANGTTGVVTLSNSTADVATSIVTAAPATITAAVGTAHSETLSYTYNTVQYTGTGATETLAAAALQTHLTAAPNVTAATVSAAGAVSVTAPSQQQTALQTQYDGILSQITALAQDSGYQGTNLLTAGSLTVQFEGSHSLTISGFDASATGLGLLDSTGTGTNGWSNATTGAANITASITALDAATTTLSSNSSSLASNLSIITVRQDFSTNMENTLTTGADDLTLADTNEEGANMLMLQTRQSLGVTALSLSSQAAQSVLKLFA
jgi:hypothetical protein